MNVYSDNDKTAILYLHNHIDELPLFHSVIIPKPGKPTYSTPKSFRPIVLLNTVGKFIEKMISNCLQFDMIKYDLVHPDQVGGVHQCSTENDWPSPLSIMPCFWQSFVNRDSRPLWRDSLLRIWLIDSPHICGVHFDQVLVKQM